MFKTAPGTKMHPVQRGRHGRRPSGTSRCPREDVRAGFSHTDDYRLSAADYYEHLVAMFQGWHEHPEVVAGRWPATLEQAFGIAPRVRLPAVPRGRRGAGRLLHRRVRARPQRPQRAAQLRRASSSTGPEYLTVFEGATGRGAADRSATSRAAHDDGLHVGRLRAGPHRAGQPGRPVPGRRGLPRRPAPVGGLRPRLLHPHHAGRLRLGRPAGCTSAGSSTAAGCR